MRIDVVFVDDEEGGLKTFCQGLKKVVVDQLPADIGDALRVVFFHVSTRRIPSPSRELTAGIECEYRHSPASLIPELVEQVRDLVVSKSPSVALIALDWQLNVGSIGGCWGTQGDSEAGIAELANTITENHTANGHIEWMGISAVKGHPEVVAGSVTVYFADKHAWSIGEAGREDWRNRLRQAVISRAHALGVGLSGQFTKLAGLGAENYFSKVLPRDSLKHVLINFDDWGHVSLREAWDSMEIGTFLRSSSHISELPSVEAFATLDSFPDEKTGWESLADDIWHCCHPEFRLMDAFLLLHLGRKPDDLERGYRGVWPQKYKCWGGRSVQEMGDSKLPQLGELPRPESCVAPCKEHPRCYGTCASKERNWQQFAGENSELPVFVSPDYCCRSHSSVQGTGLGGNQQLWPVTPPATMDMMAQALHNNLVNPAYHNQWMAFECGLVSNSRGSGLCVRVTTRIDTSKGNAPTIGSLQFKPSIVTDHEGWPGGAKLRNAISEVLRLAGASVGFVAPEGSWDVHHGRGSATCSEDRFVFWFVLPLVDLQGIWPNVNQRERPSWTDEARF